TRCPGPYVMKEIPVSAAPASAPGGGMSAPKPAPKPAVQDGKLVVDGRWGVATSKALQQFLKSKGHNPGAIDGRMGPKSWRVLQEYLRAPYKDGKISRQSYRHTELGNGISPNGWEYTGRKSKGSQTIELLQKWAGASVDGVLYEGTTRAVQRKLNAGGRRRAGLPLPRARPASVPSRDDAGLARRSRSRGVGPRLPARLLRGTRRGPDRSVGGFPCSRVRGGGSLPR